MPGFSGKFAEGKSEKPSSVEIAGTKVVKEKYYRFTPKKKLDGVKYPALCWVLDLSYDDRRDIIVEFQTSDEKKHKLKSTDFEAIADALPDENDRFEWIIDILG